MRLRYLQGVIVLRQSLVAVVTVTMTTGRPGGVNRAVVGLLHQSEPSSIQCILSSAADCIDRHILDLCFGARIKM